MAKMKKKDGGGGGSPAWMSTFSDLMNLLLCFFVLLFAMSTPDQEKFQQLSAALASSFSMFSAGSSSIGEGVLIGSGASQLNELAQYYNNMGMNSEGEITTDEIKDAREQVEELAQAESDMIAENIEQKLAAQGLSEEVEVESTSSYVVLNLNSGILFDSGKADLKPEALTLISKVADIIREYDDNTIAIEGHTDNVPISSSQFPDNVMLSMYRAHSVYSYLVKNEGFNDTSMISIGRGESVPVASNSTAEGRAQNRRVEIKIYNSYNGFD
jgi:chemotaxis protein MotB